MSKLLLSLSLVAFLSVTAGCSLKVPRYSQELGGFVMHGKEGAKKNSESALRSSVDSQRILSQINTLPDEL
jgi:hypothetical protein